MIPFRLGRVPAGTSRNPHCTKADCIESAWHATPIIHGSAATYCAVRMEHARQLADGAVGPAHGGDPRLQVVRVVLVAEVLLACLQDPRALHLRQVWWWRGENKCDRCRAWEVNSIYFFITHQLLPHHLEMRLVRQ